MNLCSTEIRMNASYIKSRVIIIVAVKPTPNETKSPEIKPRIFVPATSDHLHPAAENNTHRF